MPQWSDFNHFIANFFAYITSDTKAISIIVSIILLLILYVVIKKFIRKFSSVVKYYFFTSIGLSSANIITTVLSYFTIALPFGINNFILNSGSLITLLIGLWKMKKELEQLGI